LSLSNEQACKLIRNRTVSKAWRTFNAGPGRDLSPFSGVRGCGELSLGFDGCGWLFALDDKQSLSFNAGCALILPVSDEVPRGSTSDADNHC
jgi:hypothetical protein